jgi:hypothetical protein
MGTIDANRVFVVFSPTNDQPTYSTVLPVKTISVMVVMRDAELRYDTNRLLRNSF